MGLLGSLLKTVVDVATIPLDIIEDVVNIGDGDKSKTIEKIDIVIDDTKDIIDDII